MSFDGVVDIFAGCGGWDEGLRAAGHAGPLVGTDEKTLQIGNAVPPPLAAAVLCPLLSDAGRAAA